jgi:DNA-binding MarR family transcriptional regulator
MPQRKLAHLPDALSSHIGYLLVVLGKHSQRVFTDALARHNLRPPHFDILATVGAQGSLSQAALAKILCIEPAHMVSLLDELQKQFLLERKNSSFDRRKYEIVLTVQGQKSLRLLKKVALEIERELMKNLSAKEQAILRRLLQNLAKNKID